MKTTTKLSIVFIAIILIGFCYALVSNAAGAEAGKAVASVVAFLLFAVIGIKVFKLNDGGATNAIHR